MSIRTRGELPFLVPSAAEQAQIGATLAAPDAEIQAQGNTEIQAHGEIARATRACRSVLADALLSGVLTAGPLSRRTPP